MKRISAHFADEIVAAGLAGLPFAWGDDGALTFDPRITPAQRAAVEAVAAAHDPEAKPVPTVDPARARLAALDDGAPVTGADLKAILAERLR